MRSNVRTNSSRIKSVFSSRTTSLPLAATIVPPLCLCLTDRSVARARTVSTMALASRMVTLIAGSASLRVLSVRDGRLASTSHEVIAHTVMNARVHDLDALMPCGLFFFTDLLHQLRLLLSMPLHLCPTCFCFCFSSTFLLEA